MVELVHPKHGECVNNPTGSSHFGQLGKDPNYGLGKKRSDYRLDGQPPAGPKLRRRLTNWGRRPSRSHSETAHGRVLAGARVLLLASGAILGLWGLIGGILFHGGAEIALGLAGAVLLALFAVSRWRPAPALDWSVAVLIAAMPVVGLRLLTYGSHLAAVWALQAPVPAVVLGAMILVMLRFLAGARSARALAAVEDGAPG